MLFRKEQGSIPSISIFFSLLLYPRARPTVLALSSGSALGAAFDGMPFFPSRFWDAEDMQRKSKWPRDVTKDNPVLCIPKPRRKEQRAIKGSPQSAPRRKGEYSRTRMGVQCRSGSRKSCHIRIECANKRPGCINGERTLEQYGFAYCN